jgi:copper transporter 1
MLWNWNTVDTCFIAKSWHITSRGMFAGSCIGVVLLVILLEFLRRLGKEYDRLLLRQHKSKIAAMETDQAFAVKIPPFEFRPTVFQQMVRALLHMCQFAVAYFVML